ncbi:MAG: hypothetical protein HY300_11435 [Verrucomicrobia bacterium]|nr:hypothetical protein [Verrucomicrobiota bacterium]
MARKTVKVDLPSNSPDDFIKLAKNLHDKHVADGDASPLDVDKMTLLGAATTPADSKNKTAKQLDAQAQTLRQERDGLLGTADGQTAETPGTMLNLLTYARDELLVKYRGTEEKLSEYGFNVLVGSAKGPTKKPKTP